MARWLEVLHLRKRKTLSGSTWSPGHAAFTGPASAVTRVRLRLCRVCTHAGGSESSGRLTANQSQSCAEEWGDFWSELIECCSCKLSAVFPAHPRSPASHAPPQNKSQSLEVSVLVEMQRQL